MLIRDLYRRHGEIVTEMFALEFEVGRISKLLHRFQAIRDRVYKLSNDIKELT